MHIVFTTLTPLGPENFIFGGSFRFLAFWLFWYLMPLIISLIGSSIRHLSLSSVFNNVDTDFLMTLFLKIIGDFFWIL